MLNPAQKSTDPEPRTIESRVTEAWSRLTRTERVVARHLAGLEAQDAMLMTADAVAAATETSDATVVRAVRKLGFDGLPALKLAASDQLRRQQLPHIQHRIELSNSDRGIESIVGTIEVELDQRIRDTFKRANFEDYQTAVEALVRAQDVFCYGWGLSELGAQYLAIRLRRMGKPAQVMNATGFGLAEQLLPISASSVVVLFVPGRHLPDVDLVIRHSRAVGAFTILVTSALEGLSDQIDVTLRIAYSRSGVTAEPLAEMVCADVLLLALVAHMPEKSMQTYDLMRRLRIEALEGP